MAKAILVLVLLLGAISLSIVGYLHFAQEPLISTIESPDKTYVLHLTGKKTRPSLPLIVHSVYFDLFRGNEAVVLKRKLHSGYWLDAAFEDSYPRHNWVARSVIMFHRENIHEVSRDTLTLTNNSNKPISYLRVQSVDLFLLFDLKPQSKITLSAYPQTWLSWITVEGEFEDGQIIKKSGTNFSVDPKLKGPFRYEISINESGPRIESPQLVEAEAQTWKVPSVRGTWPVPRPV